MNRSLRPFIIGVGVIFLVLVIFLVVGALAGDRDGVPITGSTGDDRLGRLFVSSQVLDNGCPVEESARFITNQPVYTGFEDSRVPAGSTIQTRIFREDALVTESEEITVDESAQGRCITFTFPPDTAGGFPVGDYTAQLLVDGELADEASFTVDAGLP